VSHSGSFTVTLSETDLLNGFRLHARLGRARPLILAAILVAMLLCLLLIASPAARHSATHSPATLLLEGALLLALLLVASLGLAIRPLWRRAARRTLAERRDLREPVRYEFSPETFRRVSCFSDSTWPWTALSGWREDDRILMIYPARQLFHAIPKDKVDPAVLAALREALGASALPRI